LRGQQGRLFELAIPAAVEFKSPRACAFALLGLHEYLDSFPGIAPLGAADDLANRLLNSYRAVHSTGWTWFEYSLAYSNARLPQALIRAGMRGGNDEMISAGLEALDWLGTIQRCEIKVILCLSGHMASIRGKRKGRASINSRSKLAPSCRLACRPIALREKAAGGKRRVRLQLVPGR